MDKLNARVGGLLGVVNAALQAGAARARRQEEVRRRAAEARVRVQALRTDLRGTKTLFVSCLLQLEHELVKGVTVLQEATRKRRQETAGLLDLGTSQCLRFVDSKRELLGQAAVALKDLQTQNVERHVALVQVRRRLRQCSADIGSALFRIRQTLPRKNKLEHMRRKFQSFLDKFQELGLAGYQEAPPGSHDTYSLLHHYVVQAFKVAVGIHGGEFDTVDTFSFVQPGEDGCDVLVVPGAEDIGCRRQEMLQKHAETLMTLLLSPTIMTQLETGCLLDGVSQLHEALAEKSMSLLADLPETLDLDALRAVTTLRHKCMS